MQVVAAPPRRGRGRGGRARPRRAAPPPPSRQASQPARGAQGFSAGVRIRDTEVLAIKPGFQYVTFCPSKTGLPRLDREGDKFTRWKLHSVSITFKATAPTTETGDFAFGILPGPYNKAIKDKATILTLRPFKLGALWKSESISVGKAIMPQPFLYTDAADDRDCAAFCVYYIQSDNKTTGCLQISYDVQLSYPNP